MSLQSASSITPASPETRYIRPLFRRDFQIAIICALPLEYDAASLLVDEFWDEGGKQYGRTSGDSNTYRNGRIGMHNVVLMLLPGMGKVAIAVSAASLRTSYSGLRLAFLVGVCGGAPGIHEILLGDVVVSDDVIQYDFGRQYPGTFVPKETVASSRVSSKDIRSLIAYFQTEPGKRDLQGDAAKHLKALQEASIFQGYQHRYVCPGAKEDKLFAASYHHKHRRSSCNLCRVETETFCEEASKTPCAKLGCDEGELVGRKRLQEQDKSPQVFIGRIASGDTVMKSGKHRDEVAKQYDVIAFEMEGAGIWDEIPSIIVKGVCDYADSHKNKSWQPFAAATAAAVTKSMLTRYSLTDGTEMSMQVVDAPQSHSNLLGTKQKERLHMQSLVPFTAARKGQWQPLQEAISHFQRGLSEPQSRELRSTKVVPNVDSVLIFTAQLDYNNRTRKGTSIGSRFYSVLQSVREFCVAVESFPSWPSKIAVLLWGSLKLTINVRSQSEDL
ncbi:hypothetical protein N7456_009507 [Penicillium angulare]|uniref:Nucleoside phosphorylase domain-containing protein n=1 Tax=Penicillium angulare TaxID=116970 RepID=A0A9W9K5S9_9EURO|nr:hypothetical protein N7456_009507 [Penicillium angulare]